MSNLITEAGDRIVQEDIAGLTGASSLNDTRLAVIYTETFTTNPILNSWMFGSGWAWDVGNGNMEVA